MSKAYLDVRFETSLGVIKGKVCIDKGPMHLRELVPTAYELTNILVKRAKLREEKAGRQISCQSGCGICCCQMVPLSIPEAFYLVDLIDSLDINTKVLLLKRFGAIVHRLEQEDIINDLMEPEYLDGPVLSVAKKYFFLQMPCPFLKSSSCSIYPFRPVACREYNVTSPASWCSNPYMHDIEKVLMPMPFSAPLARLAARLSDTKPRLIPLTLLQLWASEHTDLKVQTWPGLDLFKAFMEELGSLKEIHQ